MTTCGLTAAGNACQDAGEDVPLHGKIGNTPAERVSYLEEEEQITLWARVSEAAIFTHKLVLDRTLRCSKTENKLVLTDKVTNVGGAASPSMMLYHFNMGYPLLCERSELYIPSTKVLPRNERAAEGLERWAEILPPQPVFEEQCYYHQFNKAGTAAIYNPELGKGLAMTFDAEALPYFVQWKMLGAKDYVMGLEPGNCLPDGRCLKLHWRLSTGRSSGLHGRAKRINSRAAPATMLPGRPLLHFSGRRRSVAITAAVNAPLNIFYNLRYGSLMNRMITVFRGCPSAQLNGIGEGIFCL